MLIQKLNKKFGAQSGSAVSEDQINQIIITEVSNFIRYDKVTRETLKVFETQIEDKIAGMLSPRIKGGKMSKQGSHALMQSGRSVLGGSIS
jgi:hypothetical protein